MNVRVTFSENGQAILDVTYPVAAVEEGQGLFDLAFAEFRKQFPEKSLFDGLSVRFDKVE
jgi:hypothetical protein